MDDLLFVEHALPDDGDLDRFCSGDDEVDAWFTGRAWFQESKGKASPATYKFSAEKDGDAVGYASAQFTKRPHPNDASDEKAKDLLVYVVGVNARFQGARTHRDPTITYAAALFDELRRWASEKSGCVGIQLRVRASNERARGFYRKVGFVDDPAGQVDYDAEGPHITMRLLLP